MEETFEHTLFENIKYLLKNKECLFCGRMDKDKPDQLS